MRIKTIPLIFILLATFLNFPKLALATSINISNIPLEISEQPFEFNVSITGAQPGTNYLRANFFPAGTTHYFGFTYNGSNFYNGSDFTQYLSINIDSSGNWSGVIQAKIDPSSNYFSGSGEYNLKVRRYTGSGSYTWSNEVSLYVNSSTSSPSPTPGPSTSPSPTPGPSAGSDSGGSPQFIISNIPENIDSDETFSANLTLNLPNNPNSIFYMKGAFIKSGGSNYFGLTKVGETWVKNSSSYSEQKRIQTDSSGNYSGTLEIGVDNADSGFSDSGDYIFKIARYNESGSGPAWSNEVIIHITKIDISDGSTDPTPTPLPSSSPRITPAATNPLVSSTKSLKSSSNLPIQLLGSSSAREATIAGVSTQSGIVANTKINNGLLPKYLILGVGILVVGLSIGGFVVVSRRKKFYGG